MMQNEVLIVGLNHRTAEVDAKDRAGARVIRKVGPRAHPHFEDPSAGPRDEPAPEASDESPLGNPLGKIIGRCPPLVDLAHLLSGGQAAPPRHPPPDHLPGWCTWSEG